MKRFAVLLCAAMLAVTSAAASPFSDYTDEELAKAYLEIVAEISARQIDISKYATSPTVQTYTFVYNKNTKKYHYEWCGSVHDMKPKNRGTYTGTTEEMRQKGYEPCKRCKP